MPNVDRLGDDAIREILTSVRTIAMVGASPSPARPSNGVLGFLIAKGFETYPVGWRADPRPTGFRAACRRPSGNRHGRRLS